MPEPSAKPRAHVVVRLLRLLGLKDLGYVGKWVGLAAVIGFAGGLAAVGFDWLTHAIKEHALARAGVRAEGLPEIGALWWLVLVVPALGGLVVGLVIRAVAPDAGGHGTEQMIRAFHSLDGKIRARVVAVKALASALTIGSGGSGGLEGPVTQVGGGVGSMLSDALKLRERDRRVFLLSGAAAGVGALFTAPLGGALFAPEVLYKKPEFEGEAIIPCIVSSIVAYTTFASITGRVRAVPIDGEILRSLSFRDPRELLVYLALALLCTAVGWLYVRGFEGIHGLFQRVALPAPVKPMLGGLLLGGLALGLSPLAGEHGVLYGGYELMRASIAGALSVKVLLVLIGAKILATSFSIGSGGSGGVFAPSLAIGALLGSLVGTVGRELFPELGINPSAFALVGMGGFFAGVAKTPIAAIIMVCEMTGNYALLAPLMLVSIVHVVLARGWTIYDTQVEGLVDSPAHAGDFVVDVLERMKVSEVIDPERAPVLVNANATLRKALQTVATSAGTYFPVVDDSDQMVGIFSLSDIRRIFQEVGVQDLVIVRDFMVDRVATVKADDTLDRALHVLNEYSIHEIPVVDRNNPRRVLTMLSRNNIGAAYHQRLRELRMGKS